MFVVTQGYLGPLAVTQGYTPAPPPPPSVPAGVWMEATRPLVWTEPTRPLVWSGPMIQLFVKRQDESNVPYAYDFVNDAVVAGGDPLASVVSVTATSLVPTVASASLTVGSGTITGTRVNVRLGGGVDGATYQLEFVVLTVGGVQRVGLGRLRIQDEQ